MDGNNVVKTEVILTEKSVEQIVIAEAAKAMSKMPGFLEGIIEHLLTYREPKRYSSDPEKPTYMEAVIAKTLKPIVEEEMIKIANKHRKKLSSILSKAFKTGIIDHKDFEDRLIKEMAGFTSNIRFYVPD